MTDPVTIGTLAATALAMASDEGFKGFVGEAAKDAYKALREKIAHWAGRDVEALEETPGSTARRNVVAEVIDGQPPEDQATIKALAVALIAALKSEAEKSSGPVGLDVNRLETLEVQLGVITVREGTGARFKDVKMDTFTVQQINVGPPPGKTDR